MADILTRTKTHAKLLLSKGRRERHPEGTRAVPVVVFRFRFPWAPPLVACCGSALHTSALPDPGAPRHSSQALPIALRGPGDVYVPCRLPVDRRYHPLPAARPRGASPRLPSQHSNPLPRCGRGPGHRSWSSSAAGGPGASGWRSRGGRAPQRRGPLPVCHRIPGDRHPPSSCSISWIKKGRLGLVNDSSGAGTR